jgi:hypothetical protein
MYFKGAIMKIKTHTVVTAENTAEAVVLRNLVDGNLSRVAAAAILKQMTGLSLKETVQMLDAEQKVDQHGNVIYRTTTIASLVDAVVKEAIKMNRGECPSYNMYDIIDEVIMAVKKDDAVSSALDFSTWYRDYVK